MAMALSEEFEFLQKRMTMLQYQVLQCHQGLAKVSGEMEEVAARLQAAAALASKAIPVSEKVSPCEKIGQPKIDKDNLASRVLLTENENSEDVCHNPDFSYFQHWREVIEELPVFVENKTCVDANDVSASKMKDQLMEKTENIIVSKPVLRKIGSRTSKDSLKSQKCQKNNHEIKTSQSNASQLEPRSVKKIASKIGQGTNLNEKEIHESDNISSCPNSSDKTKETYVKSLEHSTPPAVGTNSLQSDATSSTSADKVSLEGMKLAAEKLGRELKETCARRGWRITGDYKSAPSLSGTKQDRDRLYIYQVTVTDGENVNLFSQGCAYSKPIAARLALNEMKSKMCGWNKTT